MQMKQIGGLRSLYYESRKIMIDNLGFLIHCEKVIINRLESERDRLSRKHRAIGCTECREVEERIRQLEEKISLHSDHLTQLKFRQMLFAT